MEEINIERKILMDPKELERELKKYVKRATKKLKKTGGHEQLIIMENTKTGERVGIVNMEVNDYRVKARLSEHIKVCAHLGYTDRVIHIAEGWAPDSIDTEGLTEEEKEKKHGELMDEYGQFKEGVAKHDVLMVTIEDSDLNCAQYMQPYYFRKNGRIKMGKANYHISKLEVGKDRSARFTGIFLPDPSIAELAKEVKAMKNEAGNNPMEDTLNKVPI